MTKRGEASSSRRKLIAFLLAFSAHGVAMLLASREELPVRARDFVLHHPHDPSVELLQVDKALTDRAPSQGSSAASSAAGASGAAPSSAKEARSRGAVNAPRPDPRSDPIARAGKNGAGEAGDDRGESDHYDLGAKSQRPLDGGALGLSLGDAIAIAPKAAPAPTTTPAPTPVTGQDTARALEASIRSNDSQIGLGNPEEGLVAAAVQTAGRATPVPSGTRARFAVDIDSGGVVTGVTLLSASKGGGETWGDAMSQIRNTLSKKPVQLGPNAKRKGVRVIVEATVLHVFASGTDKLAVVGACPTIPMVGGETTLGLNGPSANASGFGAIGGAAYGDLPSGTCLTGDAQTTKKQIVVRTKTQAIFPGEKQAPPPFDSIPAVPRARPLNLWRLILGNH